MDGELPFGAPGSFWLERRELADQPGVTIRILDADNHLFFAGSEPSTMDDYRTAQHVDPETVTTIADWLH